MDTLMTAAGLAETARHRMLATLRDRPGSVHSYDEFCEAVELGLPGGCVGLVIPHSASIPSPRATRRYAAQLRAVRAEIAAQLDTARALVRVLEVARGNAGRIRPRCGGDDCETVLRTIIRPALLEREILVHRLVARRLSSALDTLPTDSSTLRSFEARYQAANSAFLRELMTIGRETFKKAIGATAPLAKRSPALRPLVETLRQKAAIRSGDSLPASDRPDFLVMGDAFGKTR